MSVEQSGRWLVAFTLREKFEAEETRTLGEKLTLPDVVVEEVSGRWDVVVFTD